MRSHQTPPFERPQGPPVSYGPQQPYVGPPEAERGQAGVSPPEAAESAGGDGGEGLHPGEDRRSPDAGLNSSSQGPPKTFYPPKWGERGSAGPPSAGPQPNSVRPPADADRFSAEEAATLSGPQSAGVQPDAAASEADDTALTAEEAARLQREDEHFRAWRHFEHRRTASQSETSESFKPTWAKANADAAFKEDLARGATRHEAFKRYKSRVRAAAKQHEAGPPPVNFNVSRGPAMQSKGGFHRRTVMNRLHALALAGFEPTDAEYSQAVTMEHLADMVAQRATEASDRAATGQPYKAGGAEHAQADTGRKRSRSRGH